LGGADARIFQLHLRRLAKGFEENHTSVLDNVALLITVDGEEHYWLRSNLKKKDILTIEDMIIRLEVNDITHVLIDGILITNRLKKLDDIYVLELFTKDMYESPKLESKLTKR
jgi:hypothetical protein